MTLRAWDPDRWYRDLIDQPLPDDSDTVRAALLTAALAQLETIPEPEAPAVMSVSEALEEWIREEQAPDEARILTGWPTMDAGLTRKIRAGEVVGIAARTGVGKTWIVQHLLERALAGWPAHAAVLLELEMPAYQIAERIASHALDVSPSAAAYRAKTGRVQAGDVMSAAPFLERLVIAERSTPVSKIPDVLAAARERGQEPTILAIDYLGLLAWDGSPRAGVYERASENAKVLKDVVKREHVICLVACQLSRNAGDGSKEPSLEDLRDSGVIEEAADRVLLFWRDEDDDRPVKIGEGHRLAGKIAKNRHGAIGYRTDLVYDHALRLREKPTLTPQRDRLPFE